MSFKTLYQTVIQTQLCCFCGACVSVCSENCIVFSGEGPKIVKPCKECGNCISACPGRGAPLSKLSESVFTRELTADEDQSGLGIIIKDRDLVSRDPSIFKIGYTGGKVTALLNYLLNTGAIDGAIVTTCGDSSPYPFFSWPRIATSTTELVQCSGSKYMFSPNLMVLKDLADTNHLRSVAFVGMGCHVIGLRKLQLLGEKFSHLTHKITYVFGLFCGSGMLSSDDFLKLIAKLCDTTVEDIDAVDFKRSQGGSKFVVEYTATLKNGRIKSRKILIDDLFYMINLLDQWNRCRMCTDYSCELADISFGGKHIVSRTPKGEELMQAALSEDVLISDKDPLRKEFLENATRTDIFMIRKKKFFNPKRISKNIKKHLPVPEFQ